MVRSGVRADDEELCPFRPEAEAAR